MLQEVDRSEALKKQYKEEQSEGLHRINRFGAIFGTLLVAYLAFFSDPVNFPEFYREMLPGRLFVIVFGVVIAVLSFVPAMKSHGRLLSFFVFLAVGLMMAHLSGVMDNQSSSVTAWIFLNIIFCGIYPLPTGYSALVVVISNIYYLIIFFTSGYEADLDFRMTLINVNSASFVTLAFKIGMERIRKREFFFRKSLQTANEKIATLNERLKDENLRLTHELQIAQHIQSIVLPKESDYNSFGDLDIACCMVPATEVGGDFYDTISLGDTGIISIGDVTDHGLHSGLIMMMVHTALRALSKLEKDDIQTLFSVINEILYDFRLKTDDHRIMSLIILKYLGDGNFEMTGQHESLLIVRGNGAIEEISSFDFGMFAGLDESVSGYLGNHRFSLEDGDALVLYTDGVTEAMNESEQLFGKKGLMDAIQSVAPSSSEVVKDAILNRCRDHIGTQKLYDDISIMVVRKKTEIADG